MEEEEAIYEPEDEGSRLPPDAQMASDIFNRENVDGILDRGVGTYLALQTMRYMNLGIPRQCTVKDIIFLIDGVESEGDFIEETYINFFVECLNIIKNEFSTGEDEEPEDVFDIDEKFIQERLSDLQPVEDQEFTFTFTSFLVQNAEITGITALEKFEALLSVSLKTNFVQDISPLCKLPRLKHIDLFENKVTEIKDLEFPQLETLNLSHNNILCVESLRAPKLKSLNLSNNKIFFIAPFAFQDCSSLEELNLGTNSIRTLKEQCFQGLCSLKSLKIEANQLTNMILGFTRDMKKLADLDVSDNPIQALQGIDILTGLEVLDIHKTNIEQPIDLACVRDIVGLKYLYIYESPLADFELVRLELIHLLPQLEEIDEQQITYQERQDAEQLMAERAAEEQRALEEELALQEATNEEEEGDELRGEYDLYGNVPEEISGEVAEGE